MSRTNSSGYHILRRCIKDTYDVTLDAQRRCKRWNVQLYYNTVSKNYPLAGLQGLSKTTRMTTNRKRRNWNPNGVCLIANYGLQFNMKEGKTFPAKPISRMSSSRFLYTARKKIYEWHPWHKQRLTSARQGRQIRYVILTICYIWMFAYIWVCYLYFTFTVLYWTPLNARSASSINTEAPTPDVLVSWRFSRRPWRLDCPW